MTSLDGQTVLVTGANRGMGREYVGQLLDRGATKVYAAAREPRTIDDSDPRVIALALDVTDASSIRAAGQAAPDVSVLINNAGILRGSSVLDPDTTGLRQELDTNLFGPLAMASTFADRIADEPVRSSTSHRCSHGGPWVQSYGVSKAAMWSATDSMRLELAPKGFRWWASTSAWWTPTWPTSPTVPKAVPSDVIRQVLDGIESGADEVLADELTRRCARNSASPLPRVCWQRALQRARRAVSRA